MSLSESNARQLQTIAERVVTALRLSTSLMQKLRQGLAERRTSWIAARPSTVQEPATALETLARELAAETARTQQLYQDAKALLPAPAATAATLHVDASLLASHVPPALATRLRAAGATAADAARAVRVEQAVGERLLRFSQRAHEHLMAGVANSLATAAVDVGGYDRAARRTHSALGPATATGTLVDGRI